MICRDTPTHGWVCGWMGGSVGQWVGSGHVTKYQINLDVIEIIQFCLKIYGWVYGSMDGSMGGVRSND